MEITISPEQIEMLDKLFNAWEAVSINTDEDYQKFGQMFSEDK